MTPIMLRHVPSRDALRVLARLCRNQQAQGRQYCSVTALQSPRLRVVPCPRSLCPRQGSLPSTIRHRATLVDAPERQTFANDPSRYDPLNRTGGEPNHQGTSDPQMDASQTSLPDISNYYTLFPKTLPGGPPRPQSNIPDSNAAVDTNPPKPRFHIHPRTLRKEFLQLQSLHHPDKFPSGSVAHQRAYALSTLLNNAFRTLSDPLLRAQYLLQMLYDIDVTNEDNSAHPSDPETLMIVMEAQEELEHVASEGGEDVVGRLTEENRGRIRETERELEAAFESGDVEEARDQTVKLKYWRSLEGALRDWEPGKEVRLTH